MKLTITFRFEGPTKVVDWFQPLDDFPKHFRYSGKKWEWAAYDRDPTSKSDYALLYSELPSYDPNFYIDMEDFEAKFFGSWGHNCTCGASYSSFEWDHMRYCAKYTKW